MDQLINDVLGDENSLYDEDEPSEAGSEAEDHENPTLAALRYLRDSGISLSKLLDNVMFCDDSIRGDRLVINARNGLFSSSVLPLVMTRARKPPKMRIRGQAHINARKHIEEWALSTSTEVLQKELAQFAKTTKSPATETEVVDEEALKELTFDAISKQVETHAPQLYNLLSNVCVGPRQDRNKLKDPKSVSKVLARLYIYADTVPDSALQSL
jgi:hypothetical protein